MEHETFARSVYEAELTIPAATARIMRLWLDGPTNRIFSRPDRYWIDMCLTPRPARARGCYREHWGPHRFEPLGEIFVMPPGQSLHVRTEAGDVQASIVCEIDRAAIDRWLPDGIDWTDRRLAAALDITHSHMRACLFRLAEEVRHPGTGSLALTEMIVGQLAIEVGRYVQAIAEGAITGGLASWRLRLIDERLQRKGSPPSLEELAGLCSVSVRQLTRGFRTSRGCSIGDHIASSRIDLAKRLLKTPQSIKTIAFSLGFASPSSFSFAFRRATGSTPRLFRARQLQRAC